jgi:hypothetical protein
MPRTEVAGSVPLLAAAPVALASSPAASASAAVSVNTSPPATCSLETFLVGARLQGYVGKVTSLGAVEVSDLAHIEDAQLSGLGMTTVEIRRLRRHQTEQQLPRPDTLSAGQQVEAIEVPAHMGNVEQTAAPQPMTMHQPPYQQQAQMMHQPPYQQQQAQMMLQQQQPPMMQQAMMQQAMMQQPTMQQQMVGPTVPVVVGYVPVSLYQHRDQPHTECTRALDAEHIGCREPPVLHYCISHHPCHPPMHARWEEL